MQEIENFAARRTPLEYTQHFTLDIQNLYYSAKVIHKKKVNFGQILKDAVGDRKLIRAIAYGIKTLEGMDLTNQVFKKLSFLVLIFYDQDIFAFHPKPPDF